MPDRREIALERGEQRPFRASTQHLAKEGAALLEHLAGKQRRRLRQGHDLQVVGLPVAGRISRHVRKHEVGFSVQDCLQPVGGVRLEEIEREDMHARERRHFEPVDRDHAPASLAGADPLGRDLAPTARRGAEIDDFRARPQQAIFVIELDQLEGRARAEALALGACHIGVVELAFEPTLLRRRSALPALHARLERTGAST